MTTGLIYLGVFALGALVIRLWWKFFNTADGEHYLKMRMQGPFVPVQPDDAEQLNK